MRILTLFLVLFISVSVYAGDLDVDRITLSTFHEIKRSLETLPYSIEYSAKIVCDDNFGSIVLTVYDKGLKTKRGGLLIRVHNVLRKIPKESPLFFDLYVELVFPNPPYSEPLFLIPAHSNSYKRVFTEASDYYQRDISPYHQRRDCSVCGGGSTFTKYGKLSHVAGCRYTLKGRRNNTLRTSNIPKSRKVQSKRSSSTGRPKTVSVGGYYRKDGTYVRPYKRRAPRRKTK